MARIRSIKPEFWTDGTNITLSDSCALFFIALWNFCDDEGKHPLDLNQLVAELGGRWHRGKIKLFMSCLVKSGQLRINSDSTWIQVTGWSHQKIDKPKQPDTKSADIQWLSYDDSTKVLERSRGIDARIGSDRRDRIGSRIITKVRRVSDGQAAIASAEQDKIRPFIARYVEAYQARYGLDAKPSLDGKSLGMMKKFLRETPEVRALELIEAYCRMGDAWFITKAHDFGTFIQNLTKVGLFLDTGTKFSVRQAVKQETFSDNATVFNKFLNEGNV